MHIIIIVLAILLTIWPAIKIINGIFKIGFALFSGIFNTFGKLLIIGLVLLGIIMTFPWGMIPGVILFIVLKAVKS
ncbi:MULTISPECIES: hypothetical protein [Metabacillus]|uniref:hypothetical protein n=1 Tax=Metabacillus TaxID=2675233 RepID=UPI001E557AF4|nr:MULTISPECIES: hypothetical protein [Metabacillus]MCM3162623.1 hypothetical protein [Metabacillus litoralis]UGB30507.1 hypothetical protein LPC09_22890 [Metabacillus sp. B2-18]